MKIFGKWIFAVIFFICMLTPATVMTVSADDGIEPEAANAIETEVTQDVPDVITEEVNATVTGNDKEEYVSDQKSGISETVSLNTESTCGKDGEEAVNDSVLTEENSSSIEEGVSVTEVSSDDSEKADDELISQNNTDEASNESTESVAEGESQQENECNDQQKAGSAIAMEEPSTATNTVADNPILEKSDIPANAPLMASANGSMISDYEYIVDDDQVTITKYNGLASVLNLPEEITGYSVTGIDSFAFECNTELTSIDIPASVCNIGYRAFAGCESLETVIFHENNGYIPGTHDRFSLSIGASAFEGCISLTELSLPESVTVLGDGFINGTGITTITLPKNLTDASLALYGSRVEEVVFADGMERIPNGVCDADEGLSFIQSVVIPETVTEIGAEAFHQCVSLYEIELPNSLREIENHAFNGCTGLSSIDIPASVFYIGGYAFAGCESLETVTFHENNGYMPGTNDRFSLSIGNYAFSGCTSLTGLEFPESLTELGGGFINGTGITTITLPRNLTDASCALSGSIVEEVIFADGMERVPDGVCDAIYNEPVLVQSVVIPETVTRIGAYAFRQCVRLQEIELPNSLSEIENGAFEGCTGLSSIDLPASLREIEDNAFEGCTGLSSIDLPASVYYIGGYAFADCESLETVVFHENNGYMPGTTDRFSLSIGNYSFSGCTSLTGLEFPESLTGLGCGFINNTGITTITLPKNLTDASGALSGSIVEEVIFADGMERIPNAVCDANGESSFIESVVIPETVTDIGAWAFSECISLYEIELPNSLREIEESAFNGCTGLSSIVIPETVTDIGAGAFSQCVSLYEIELPNSLREIEGRTFCGCTGLSSIVIPETVTRIGGEAFSQCVSLYEIELPNWLREIDYESFNGCTGLSSIDIPASVYYIGHSAFADCESLETVVFHENNGYMPGTTDRFRLRIMDSAFSGCTSLTGLVFPESLTELGSESLRNTGITTITLPRNLTYAYNALMGSIVEEVIFADGMTCIPDQVCNAWGEPSYIQTVVIPDTVTRIGDAVFMNCEALSDIYFEGSEIRWNSIDKESAEIPDGTVIHFLETPVKILEILTLSDDYYGKNGTQAAFHIEALGTGDLTYQWQYKTAGSNTWKSPSQASAKTADYTFNLKPSYDNIEVRCIVSDGDGNELISETRKANVFAVTAQPADAAAGIGETVVFNVSAIGKGLVYQWYFMRPSGNWKKATVAGSNTDTLSITGGTANNGTSYRCLVSDSEGNSITSSAAVLTISEILKITGLSDDWYGPDGTSAGFHVEASGSTTLSYQWQYKLAGETKWRTPGQASAKSTDYSFKMKPSYDNIEVRCIVKDASGNEVTSDTRKANVFAITAQPTDITAVEDQNVNFEVSVIGRNVTYQWYYKRPNGTWKKTTKAGSTTAVLPITAGTINDGTSYRCVITDEEGNQLTSAAGFLTLDISLKITGLSENAYDMNGSNVTFHVDAAGNGDLSYQWQYKLAGETKWRTPSQASAKTADYAFKLRPSYDNIEVRCIVTDDSGSSVISDVRKANVFAITSQPQDAELALGEQAAFAVEAIGKDLAYQWYYMRPEGSWKKVTMTGYNTAALVITANTKNDGTKYRCHITDGLGNVLVSAAATLTQT